ncbi:MAG: hypothetical protein PHH58_11745 [Rhodoferax sp.]|nr:hypothetical protein [Rhodoferax sp.]
MSNVETKGCLMNHSHTFKWVACLCLLTSLWGCVSNPGQPATQAVAKEQLTFVDWQGFDRELTGSLSSPLPKVDVSFYDRVTPSTLPERLQRWMASVESGGGTVKVVPPKSSLTAKSPFLLISAISSLWSANKTIKDMSNQAQFNSAQDYDAEIILRQDDQGDSVVDKVVFVKRKK